MKASMITTSFLAAVVTAQPIAPATVNLVLQLGDEAAVTFLVPFNQLFNAQETREGVAISVQNGQNLPIELQDIRCQCFSDVAGTQLQGQTFGDRFTPVDITSGQDVPVQIGSIFCSDAQGIEAQSATAAEPAAPAVPAAPVAPVAPVAPAAPAAPAVVNPPTGSQPTVRIQINFDGESAAQGVVPVNGQVTPTRGKFATPIGSDASILTGAGIDATGVSCQTFGDAAGTQPIGELFGGAETVILGDDVPVGAFKCSAI